MFWSWRLKALTSSGILGAAAVTCFTNNNKKNPIHCKVHTHCEELNVRVNELRLLMLKLQEQLILGLDPSTKSSSTLKCQPTYVQDYPTGKEDENCLVLDMQGTNLRVLIFNFKEGKFNTKAQKFEIPQEIMIGTSDELFDHIAGCLSSFASGLKTKESGLPLGLTFSFPYQQEALNKGTLLKWTGGFDVEGVEGNDVVELLNKSIAKQKGLNVEVIAILNDTTGTLMSSALTNKKTKIGLILGNSTKACYVERIENIPGFDGNKSKPFVIVDTGWGSFGEQGELEYLRTSFDNVVDKTSENPGKQIYEKMISGMYLGELVRLMLVKLTKEKVLFNGKLNDELLKYENFKTSYIADIESDKEGCYNNTKKVLKKLQIVNFSEQDCIHVRYICESVARRAIYLASAGVATILNQMSCPRVTVAVDGFLYRSHPHFHGLMTEKIKELVKPSICFQLTLSDDGSGRGAAAVTAAYLESLKKPE